MGFVNELPVNANPGHGAILTSKFIPGPWHRACFSGKGPPEYVRGCLPAKFRKVQKSSQKSSPHQPRSCEELFFPIDPFHAPVRSQVSVPHGYSKQPASPKYPPGSALHCGGVIGVPCHTWLSKWRFELWSSQLHSKSSYRLSHHPSPPRQ